VGLPLSEGRIYCWRSLCADDPFYVPDSVGVSGHYARSDLDCELDRLRAPDAGMSRVPPLFLSDVNGFRIS